MIQIPVNNQPNQSFEVVIPIGNENKTLGFFIYWNRVAGYWEMNLRDIASGSNLITGLPLVGGNGETSNILRQFDYLNIGEAYVVPIAADAPDYPDDEGWGITHALVWGP